MKDADNAKQHPRRRARSGDSGKATLGDVARLADVSTATVSRFLNNPELVREELRARVQQAIEAVHYVPHGAARALVSRRSFAIGAIFPTIDNAIFSRGIQSLQRRLSQAGYTLLIASSEYDPAEEMKQLDALISRGMDGVILVGQAHDPRLYDLIRSSAIPYVNTWVYDPASPHPCVGFDNREAARRMTSYLIEIGHRRIGMIAGVTRNNDRAAARVAGVRDAMAAHGLTLAPEHFIECPYDVAAGRRALRALLHATPRPTAVIGGNDVLALGVLAECRAMGIRVPQHLSVVGFDDLDISSHLDPPLTTMRVPSSEIGTTAAEYMLARLRGEPVAHATCLDISLILRSTAAPPQTDNAD